MTRFDFVIFIVLLLAVFGFPNVPYNYNARVGGGYGVPGVLVVILIIALLFRFV